MEPNEQTSPESPAPAMPLSLAAEGNEVELVGVDGGAGMVHRLAEMGLMPGARFRVITKGRPGPFIIAVKGAKLVLGHGMIHRIRVRPTDQS